MGRFFYRTPIIALPHRSPIAPIKSQSYSRSSSRSYSRAHSTLNIDPSLRQVLIETFYGILFSHHLPVLMKSGGLIDDTKFIDFDSVPEFFLSYIGKIVFFLITYFLLYYVVMPNIK
jgi:hypothetical protein